MNFRYRCRAGAWLHSPANTNMSRGCTLEGALKPHTMTLCFLEKSVLLHVNIDRGRILN